MPTPKTYQHLDDADREEISRSLSAKMSISDIAFALGRPVSTISREISRNSGKCGYRAHSAGNRARTSTSSRRGGKRRLATQSPLSTYVHEKLGLEWSPQEISKRIKEEYPDDKNMRISHEAIYQYIYVLPRGALKATLVKALRQERKYRRTKKKRSPDEEKRGKIADMLSIEERPAEVADRTIPGHWEGDLIMGKYKSTALGTLVERTTRKLILVPLGSKKDAESVRIAYQKALIALPKKMAKTLTYDQGKEMSQHKQFTIDTGIQVYFAHPASPWERGTNENTNGLLRQYFPKGTDFSEIPVSRIKQFELLMNGRPRKVLNWRNPDEVFNHLVALKG